MDKASFFLLLHTGGKTVSKSVRSHPETTTVFGQKKWPNWRYISEEIIAADLEGVVAFYSGQAFQPRTVKPIGQPRGLECIMIGVYY